MPGQIRRLIEAAFRRREGWSGTGTTQNGAIEQSGGAPAHQRGQPRGERAAAVVFSAWTIARSASVVGADRPARRSPTGGGRQRGHCAA